MQEILYDRQADTTQGMEGGNMKRTSTPLSPTQGMKGVNVQGTSTAFSPTQVTEGGNVQGTSAPSSPTQGTESGNIQETSAPFSPTQGTKSVNMQGTSAALSPTQDTEGGNVQGTSTPLSPTQGTEGVNMQGTSAPLSLHGHQLHEIPDEITNEETNYLRLVILFFRICTKAVRVLFQSHLGNPLKRFLNEKKCELKNLVLPEQWRILFPDNGSPKIERFDLTLLMTLLQKLKMVEKPSSGWQKLPLAIDKSEGADLVRIKLYRNQIIHQHDPSLSNRDFRRIWDDLSKAINRISNFGFDYEVKYLGIQTLDRSQIDGARELAQAKEEKASIILPHAYIVSIEEWLQDRNTFIETRAAKGVQNALTSSNFILISGDSGSGKSSIAHYYSLDLKENGYSVIPVISLEEIIRLWSDGIKQVFVFDDPFGKNKIDQSEVIRWQKFTSTFKGIMEDQNTKIIATARKHIAMDSQFVAFVTDLKSEIYLEIIDISNKSFLLSVDEKKEIFEKHMAHLNKQVACDSSILECSLTCFPLLCCLFAKDFQPGVSVEEFFDRPYSVFRKELQDLRNFSKLKYFCLLFCVIYDNSLSIEFIQELFQNEEEKTKIEAFLVLCDLSTSKSQYKIQSTLDSLVGTFLIKDENAELYRFVHDFIFDTIVANLPVSFHKSIIKFCSSKFIRERIRFKFMPVSDEEKKTCIFLEEDTIQVWTDRLFDDIEKGHLYDVFFNQCLQLPRIEEAFVEHLSKKSQAEKLHITSCKEKQSLNKMSSTDKIHIPHVLFNEQYLYNLEALIFRLLQEEECTVLHWVVARNLLKTFRVLWDIINANDRKGVSDTTFLLACFSGNPELIKELIKNGANVHQANQDGITPIYAAAYSGSNEVARILFKEGAELSGLKSKRSTPLIVASYNGHEKMVKLLIEKGASIDGRDTYGWTPIYAAAYNGHKNIVEILLENGTSIDTLNNKCMTPLMGAASNDHTDIVELLLSKGADPKITSLNQRSLFYEAAYRGHTSILEILLSQLKQDMVNKPDENKCTPLHAACNKGHYTSVEILIKHTANINLQDNNGCTPLFLAATMGNDKIAELLLKEGADVNKCDKDGWSPLYAASMSGHLSVTRICLVHNAKTNVSTIDSGSTPLMEASSRGHFQIVEMLLNAKASINARDFYGCTPLYNASEKGHEEIVRLLLEHGADVNIKDNDHCSPCEVAARKGHAKIANLLEEKIVIDNIAMEKDEKK